MKALLIFNEQKIKDIGHHVAKAKSGISENTGVPLFLDDDQLRLFDVFEEFGNNRYRTSYTRLLGDELPKLDKLVWTIRHYAHSTSLEIDGVDKSEWYLQNLLPPNPADTPASDQISDGELENILARNSTDMLRQGLVWCNRYYGQPENADEVSTIIHSSSYIPVYQRGWSLNGTVDRTETLAEAVQKYVSFK